MEKRALFMLVYFISLLLLGCTIIPSNNCMVSSQCASLNTSLCKIDNSTNCTIINLSSPSDNCQVIPPGCVVARTDVALVTKTFNLTNISGGAIPCPESKSCIAFFCRNETFPLLSFIEFSLKGGKCFFGNITQEQFVNWTNGTTPAGWESNQEIRPFMIGQGPTGVDFDSANPYCNNSLKMDVRWLIGRNGEAPPLPDRRVAACFLDMNAIPVYVMYTNGKNISAERAGNISAELDDTIPRLGPVFVSAEINYNSSDSDAVKNVVLELKAIKDNCPYCFTILSPKNLDKEGLNNTYNNFTALGINFNTTVDMIGQGIIANDYNDTCDPQEIVSKNVGFSRYVLATYQKPTIWLYYGISNGSNNAKTCTWTNETIAESYNFLLANIPALAHAGVLGVAPYEFTDTIDDPIPCDATNQSCDFGLRDSSGAQKHPQFNAWSDACKEYYASGGFAPLVYPSEGIGFNCSFAIDATMEKWGVVSIGGTSPFLSDTIQPDTNENNTYSCEDCITSSIPYNTYCPRSSCSYFVKDDCNSTSDIDRCASNYDVDKWLLRAIVEHDDLWGSFDCDNTKLGGQLTVREFRTYLDESWNIVDSHKQEFGVEDNIKGERRMAAFVAVTRLGIGGDNADGKWQNYIHNYYSQDDTFPNYAYAHITRYPNEVFACWSEFLDNCDNTCGDTEDASAELKGCYDKCGQDSDCYSKNCDKNNECSCKKNGAKCEYDYECESDSCDPSTWTCNP